MTTLIPITLPVSKFLSTITSFINELRFTDTLAPSDIVNDLVESCRIGKVDTGKGIVYSYKLALQPVKDLSETSTLLQINKPNIGQEVIQITDYKFVPLSESEILIRDAVPSGQLVNTFIDFIMTLLNDTSQFYLYDALVALYKGWTPRATQIIKVTQKPVDSLTGAELQATLTWNSNEFARMVRKTLNEMKVPNNNYTDVATFTDPTGATKNVVSALRGEDMKLVVNDKYWTDFLSNSMASLYHSEKIGEMIPTNGFVLLPQSTFETDAPTTMAYLHHRQKFALADFYKLTMSFKDASTLYQNTFLHFAIGLGIFKYAPGVMFVSTPPTV